MSRAGSLFYFCKCSFYTTSFYLLCFTQRTAVTFYLLEKKASREMKRLEGNIQRVDKAICPGLHKPGAMSSQPTEKPNWPLAKGSNRWHLREWPLEAPRVRASHDVRTKRPWFAKRKKKKTLELWLLTPHRQTDKPKPIHPPPLLGQGCKNVFKKHTKKKVICYIIHFFNQSDPG
jgi:hypothetical protein